MTDFEDRLDRIEAANERLRDRVDELEDAVTVEDSAGRTVTLPTLESYGLTRRQALSAMALLTAGGYTLSGAIVEAVRGASTSSGRYAAKAMQTREIRDQNDNVAINLPGGGGATIDVLNTADASAASQGEVLKKGASGTDLTFGGVGGNVPNWEEDGNSPQSATGVTSDTITLNSTYDAVLVYAQYEDVSGSGYTPALRVNGDTNSNYDFTDESGTSNSGDQVSGLSNMGPGDLALIQLVMTGRWNNRFRGKNTSLGSNAGDTHGFENGIVSSPLNSITIRAGGSFDIEWQVYGLDVNSAGIP